MTILTRPSEKKGDKLIVPLVLNAEQPAQDLAPSAPSIQNQDVESLITLRVRARRVSTLTTLCLFLTALLVVSFGILAGTHLYREYRAQMLRFRGKAQVPYPYEQMEALELKQMEQVRRYFEEDFDIDPRAQTEKITVPDFNGGRSGRFIHDFNSNLTGIIDADSGRCFVLPLNRENTLPPKNLLDLIKKMYEGYYKLDTDVIRKSYHVQIPPIMDTMRLGPYISKECRGMPVYWLDKSNGIEKRSADLHEQAKFAQFSGKGIMEIDITNFEELENYEKSLRA